MPNTGAHLTPDERRKMEQATAGLPTKSAKIRALDTAGYKRARIADFLDIRYQHVRNVLLDRPGDRSRSSRGADVPSDAEHADADEVLTHGRAKVDEEGRLILPSEILASLEVRAGGWIPWRFEDGELKLMNRAAGLRSAQAMVAELSKDYPISSDALIAERRAEAAREDEKFGRSRRG